MQSAKKYINVFTMKNSSIQIDILTLNSCFAINNLYLYSNDNVTNYDCL